MGNAWSKYVKKVYDRERKKNKDYKLKDAMKLAAAEYKKGGKKTEPMAVDEDNTAPNDSQQMDVEQNNNETNDSQQMDVEQDNNETNDSQQMDVSGGKKNKSKKNKIGRAHV